MMTLQPCPPRRVALLIGSSGSHCRRPLRGPEYDVERIAACLPAGFEIWRCTGSAATRESILRLLRELLELPPDTIVVIYFSGHGGQAWFRGPKGERIGELPEPYFVTDEHGSRPDQLDGLTNLELAVILALLYRITPYILLIVDACVAQALMRDDPRAEDEDEEDEDEEDEDEEDEDEDDRSRAARVKALAPRTFDWPAHFVEDYPGHASYADWIAAQRERGLLDPDGHPGIVRVGASTAEQPAYEVVDGAGRPGGLFTIELCALLHNCSDPISWQQLISMSAARIAQRSGACLQRPQVEGPSGRLGFGMGHEDVTLNASFASDPSGYWLSSGRIMGTAIEDRFAIRDQGRRIEVEVVEVLEARARVQGSELARVRPGALAYPCHRAHRVAVAIEVADTRAVQVRGMLSSSTRLELCRPGQVPSLRVRSHAEGLALIGASGRLERVSTLPRVLDDLDRLARAHAFVQVCAEPPGLPPVLRWRWRAVCVHDERERDLGEGDTALVGDRLWFEFSNSSACEVPGLFINVVERGVAGQLAVLNRSRQPTGVEVPHGQARRVFWRSGAFAGARQLWPAQVPPLEARPVTLFFIASAAPIDLRCLAGVVDHQPAVTRDSEDLEHVPADLAWTCRTLTFMLAPA